MTTFKIATWNVNSLRVRLPQVLDWLAQHQPDVFVIQETKILDADFPLEEIKNSGYFALISGQKTYNGVAVFCKSETSPDAKIITEFPTFADPQRRILGITVGDIRIINLYVPNGEDVTSAKYQYKLSWLAHLRDYLQQELAQHEKLIVLGDFNIAPEDRDVYNPSLWAGRVLFSEPERAAFQALLQIGLKDCFRLHEQAEKSFTWWDYRQGSFRRDMGLRIDHILASPGLTTLCLRCYIDKTPRSAERPSDHAIVIAEFEIPSSDPP